MTRFGAQAVYGRVLTLREMRDILLEEGVERAYDGYQRAERSDGGVAGWDNPGAKALLAQALKAYHDSQD